MEKITSASNPAVKRLRSLSEARSRRAENAFLVEGGVMINEALESGLKPLEALFEEEEALVSRLASLGASVRLCSRAGTCAFSSYGIVSPPVQCMYIGG